MKADRRLTILGVLLIVLSMTMATQYATTKVKFTYTVVHPSNADIRFIGSDNSSDASGRVLRVVNNGSGTQYAQINLGDWMPNSTKNYTAAFGIVNEEGFPVNITHVNVSGTGTDRMHIWIHADRDADAAQEAAANSVKVVSAWGISTWKQRYRMGFGYR
jgi:hypothetical protein